MKIAYAEAVTPHDTNALGGVELYGFAQYVYVGVSGDLVVTSAGVDITFTGVAAGEWHSMPPFSHVKSTGTTATDVVAGYC